MTPATRVWLAVIVGVPFLVLCVNITRGLGH